MINVLDSVKKLYKSDSVPKKYFVVFRDATVKRTDTNNVVHYDRVMLDNYSLTSESLNIVESICSSGNFQVGLCESATVKINAVMPDNVKGDEICILQVLGEYNPEIYSDDDKGLQLLEENTIELQSTFTSTNIISGLDTDNFDKDRDYLILAKFKYIGNPIYLSVESTGGNSRMVYYLKSGLFNFSNLETWDSTKTYKENDIVLHDDFVWKSRAANNTVEPGDTVITNAWENITKYVQVAIPIIGNEFYEYKMGIYVNTEQEYGTLDGEATIYELPYPIMPLGLFTITDCKRQNDSNIRALNGYDRMQDVGLNVDVYLPNDGRTVIPGQSEIQLGVVLDAAAEGTQIVIGSNLSKQSVHLIQSDNEDIPFPDFPQDDITTPDEDEGVIYKVTKTEQQDVEGNKYDATSVTGAYNTTLYATMKGTVIDSDNSRWGEYLNNNQLRVKGTRRQTVTKSNSRSWARSYYKYYHIFGQAADQASWDYVESWFVEGDSSNKPYDWMWFDGGYLIPESYEYWENGEYYNEHATGSFQYEAGNTYYINGKPYYCYSSPGGSVSWNGTSGTEYSTAYFYYDTQYGYYYPEIDKDDTRKWEVGQRWTVSRSEYYPSDANIPYANNFYDTGGNPIRQNAFIDCTYTYYWNYDVDTTFINELLADRWVFHHETGFNRYEWRTVAERQGSTYSSENMNRIYSAVPVYNSMRKTYQREVIYIWKEEAALKMTPYVIPQGTYDNTMAYSVYITYPTDMLAYREENSAYLLAMEQVEQFTSEDGKYRSQGVLNTNKQAQVRTAIVNNSSKKCDVTTGTYTIDGVTYTGGRFYVYWVQELEYKCWASYNGGAYQLESDKSKILRSANPFMDCVSHSKSEKFNDEPVIWQSETVHGKRRDVIKGFMELHGLFINFDRWGVSTTRNVQASTLYPAEDIYPHDSTIPGNEAYGDIYPSVGSMEETDISICKSIYIDDDLNNEFDGVLISKSQVTASETNIYPYYYNKLTRRYGNVPSGMPEVAHTPWEGNKYYVIENNFFIDNFVFDPNLLKEICKTILDNVGNLQYFNLTAELRCLPYMEVGDNINIMTPKNGYETAILRRVMKGNLAQMDSIETDFYD